MYYRVSEMVERVARAIIDKSGIRPDFTPEEAMRATLPVARAAIEAMRAPSQAMHNAGFTVMRPDGPSAAWEAMIDEALKDIEVRFAEGGSYEAV